jgi:transposase
VINEGSGGATALLGLDGFVAGAQVERDGEVWILVETTDDGAGCPLCGTKAVGNGRRIVKVRDLPAGDRPVVLVWAKRTWCCAAPECEVRCFSEETDAIAPRACLTERARAEICRRVGKEGHSVAAVAREFGVSWATAMQAVRDYGRPRVDHVASLGAPSALGLDETSFLAATFEHPTLMVTGFVDLDRNRVIDVVPGHSAKAVTDWLEAKPTRWKRGIRVVALDPFRGYATGIRNGLPHARQVVDHFHAIRLANRALDEVRRRVQNETLGHRGRKADPLYRIRRLLLVAHERLSQRGWERIEEGLRRGDPAGEVGAAYLAKELLREVYATRGPKTARRRLTRFYRHCRDARVPELGRLARTIRAWEPQVLAWHDTGLTNAATEANNLLIKKTKRVGHGFRNFDNYRLRILLHCSVSWQPRRIAPMRGRHPAIVA